MGRKARSCHTIPEPPRYLWNAQLKPGASTHGCHWSSSACASQNHFLQVVQWTVAGNPQTTLVGETAWHTLSLSPRSSKVSSIDTTRFHSPFYAHYLSRPNSEALLRLPRYSGAGQAFTEKC